MKKFLFTILMLIITCSLFGNEWKFTTSAVLQLSPVNQPSPSISADENHLAPMTEINIPIPFGQFIAQYVIPLNFGDSPVFQNANISLVAGPTLTPITLDTQFGVTFTPSPLCNIGLAATAGTGWTLLGHDGLAQYDASVNKYKPLNTFTDWKYSFITQVNFQFDFGILFPGDWTHIVTTANYIVSYEASTAANQHESWLWAGKEDVNGFQHAGNVMLGYMMPFKFKLIGLTAGWKGHFHGDDFGNYNISYDGSFVEISLGLHSIIEFSEKSKLIIAAVVPSRRGFIEESNITDAFISKTKAGREWFFNGITIQWLYSF